MDKKNYVKITTSGDSGLYRVLLTTEDHPEGAATWISGQYLDHNEIAAMISRLFAAYKQRENAMGRSK